MSRTDNTDPYDVRAWYSPAGGVHHDHRHGFCDAPQSLTEWRGRSSFECQPCFLVLARTQCSCGHRHETWWREENRRSRHLARRELGRAVALWRGGSDDLVEDVSGRPRARR